jgi:hypothetical protein
VTTKLIHKISNKISSSLKPEEILLKEETEKTMITDIKFREISI